MKRLILIIALGCFISASAQENENKTEKKKTVKTTVKTSKGEEVSTKTTTESSSQKIELSGDRNKTNQRAVKSPVVLSTKTNYSLEGKPFQLKNLENGRSGYIVLKQQNGQMVEVGNLRPMPNNEGYYLLSIDDRRELGTFNKNREFEVVNKKDVRLKRRARGSFGSAKDPDNKN